MAFQKITMSCRGCGASISLDPALRFGTCPYCGNTNSMIPAEEAAEVTPVEEIFSANFSEHIFRSAVRTFICSKPDVPDSLYETLLEREFALNFWPFYRHSLNWDATWTADIGYDNENAKDGIAWQGASGQAMGCAVAYAPASSIINDRGFGYHSCTLAANNQKEPLKFQPELLNGISWLNCDLEAKDGEKDYVMPQLEDAVVDDCNAQLPGEYAKNLRKTHRVKDRSMVLQMIPYWLFVYEWNGKTYHVMQNASSGEVAGTLPKTSRRKWITGILTAFGVLMVALASYIIYKTRDMYDAIFLLCLSLPLTGAGFYYRDVISKRKSKIKFAPVAEIGEHLNALRKFEKKFISSIGIIMVGWILSALLLTVMMPVLLPKFWKDPVIMERPEPPAAASKKVIKLKKQKVSGVKEQIVDDDGNVFEVEI